MWDVLLLDGLDVLFRVALAVLKSHEAELLRCESIPAVYVALESLPTRMWQPDKLLQVGSLPPLHLPATYMVLIVSLSCVVSCRHGFSRTNSSSARRSYTLIS